MRRPIELALAYLLVAIIWILISDRVIEWLVPDTVGAAILQSTKGLAFVALTSLLLWGLVSRDHAAQRRAAAERERLLTQLEAERTRLNVVLENMDDAALLVDDEYRVIVANRAASAVLGVPPGQLLGMDATAPSWQFFDEAGHPVPASDRPLASAMRGDRKTGAYRVAVGSEQRWVWETAAPVRDAHGRVRSVVVVVRDVTDVRRQQEQLAQGDKLRALGQLAGGVAHDLNQSLALIMGYGELLQESLERGLDDRDGLLKMARTITEAAQAGGKTVGGLLTFARGRPPITLEPIDVAALLHEVARLTAPRWQRTARAEGRTIDVTVDVEDSPTVEGAPTSLREALTNLIFNAIDAMPDGGTIALA